MGPDRVLIGFFLFFLLSDGSRADFTCYNLEDGDYSDPAYPCASTYYSCVGGQATARECASDELRYDSESNRCLYPQYVVACGGYSTPVPEYPPKYPAAYPAPAYPSAPKYPPAEYPPKYPSPPAYPAPAYPSPPAYPPAPAYPKYPSPPAYPAPKYPSPPAYPPAAKYPPAEYPAAPAYPAPKYPPAEYPPAPAYPAAPAYPSPPAYPPVNKYRYARQASTTLFGVDCSKKADGWYENREDECSVSYTQCGGKMVVKEWKCPAGSRFRESIQNCVAMPAKCGAAPPADTGSSGLLSVWMK